MRRTIIGLSRFRFGLTLAAALTAHAALASSPQPLTVTVDSPIDLGTVVAGANGDTIFRIDPASGLVSKTSGTGTRSAAGSARAVVRISCADAAAGACNTANLTLQLTPTSAPTGRARALTQMSAAMGTASLVTAPSGSPVTLTIGPVGEGLSKTVYVGADFPIAGDDSGAATGVSTTSFLVSVSGIAAAPPAETVGQAQARVIRALSMTRTSILSFGAIARPGPGTPDGTVSLDAASGARTLTGGAIALGGAVASAAGFTVTGEAGQTVSIGVPSSFALTGPGALTVTTNSTVAGSSTLAASGGAGAYNFSVGGSFPITSATPPGTYTGTLTVTADYN